MRPLDLPKIRALDLRSLEVQVAEHNAQPGAMQIGIWSQAGFREAMHLQYPGLGSRWLVNELQRINA